MLLTDVINLMYTHGATHETIVNAYKMARPEHEADINYLLRKGESPEKLVSAIKAHEDEQEGGRA